MTGIVRDARKRLSQLASETAREFDATILHNRVHEQVNGQHTRDDDLAALLDVAERAYDLAERRDDQDGGMDVFDAAEQLNDQVDALVAEQIARACAVIVTEADGWTDAWSRDQITAAKEEARRWLQQHPEAAKRADVWAEVSADA